MKKNNVQYWYNWTVNRFFFVVLFVKPEEIPKISKNIGLFYRKITRYYYNFKFELDKINEIEELDVVDTKLDLIKKKKKSKISKKKNN